MEKRGRPKGSKNKSKTQSVITNYYGHFLLNSGLIVNFDFSDEGDGREAKFNQLLDCCWPYKEDDIIHLPENATEFIMANKIVGWEIDTYETEE